MDQMEGSAGYLSACAGKEAFNGRLRAEKAAKRRPGRTSYRCAYCRMWHMGTVQPKHFKKNYRNNGKHKGT